MYFVGGVLFMIVFMVILFLLMISCFIVPQLIPFAFILSVILLLSFWLIIRFGPDEDNWKDLGLGERLLGLKKNDKNK